MVEHVQTRNQNGRPADTVLEPLVAVTERVGLAPLSSRLASIRMWLSDDLAHALGQQVCMTENPRMCEAFIPRTKCASSRSARKNLGNAFFFY